MSPTRIMVEVLDPLNPRKDQGNLLRGIDKCLVMAQSVVVESVRQPWLTVFLYFNSKA